MPQGFTVRSIQDAIWLAGSQAINQIVAFIPQLLAALIVLAFGIVLGGWVKSLIKSVLNALNISAVTKNSIIEKLLTKADIRHKIEEVIGEIARLFIVYIFLISSLNVVRLTTVADFLTQILRFTPTLFSAALILAFGILAAGFIEKLIKSSLLGFDVATARLVGKISSYTVVVFTFLIAVSELGIAQAFINTLFMGFVAMLAIGFGLAFGLGAKDLVAQVLDQWYKNLQSELKDKRTK